MGRDRVEMVVRISEHKVDSPYEEPVYGNYKYRRAERFHVGLPDKTYDITLSAWFIKTRNGELVARQGTVWIEWPIT